MIVLRGSQPEQQGDAMEMVECPCGACVLCAGKGWVKKRNMDAIHPLDAAWTQADLLRLATLAFVTPDDGVDWDYVAQHPGG